MKLCFLNCHSLGKLVFRIVSNSWVDWKSIFWNTKLTATAILSINCHIKCLFLPLLSKYAPTHTFNSLKFIVLALLFPIPPPQFNTTSCIYLFLCIWQILESEILYFHRIWMYGNGGHCFGGKYWRDLGNFFFS